ncbi:hypothetical protein E3N88_15701 [Mikania micrantha]|uniref:Chromo domain-containing protein n=1 Tax=Mikania micrantha TaxID=192012 RepID=A0A5N6NXZ4_9ASTR|nr:hypothetical protein E3N88_15701 [Mikania micrantha]
MPMEDLVIDDKLNYIEKPVAILDRKLKQLQNKTINQVMVQWNNRRGSDAKWESEDEMRKFYPFLFEVQGEEQEELQSSKIEDPNQQGLLIQSYIGVVLASYYIQVRFVGVLMGFSWVTIEGVGLMGKTLKFGVLRVSNVVNDVDNQVGTTFDYFSFIIDMV